MDYPGKVITKNQVTPTQTSATGVWTLDDAAAATRNNNWPVAGVPNPISKSLRFNSADSAYLNRTLTTPTDGKRWTWSGWVKRGILTAGTGTAQMLFSAGSALAFFRFSTTDTLLSGWTGASNLETTQVFRDPSSWYHIMLVVDTTQATESNRVKYYVNGSQITAFATTDYPTQNSTTIINSAVAHNIGAYTSSTQYFNGYMTEINFIDGQALTPSSFGMTDPVTGVWEPLKYSGTYGTNGFYLNFKDATSTTTLGLDYSGNSNTWTTNNFSVTAGSGNDSLTDVPTPWIVYNTTGDVGGVFRGNYATWNPINGVTASLTNGNLDLTYSSAGGAVSTMAFPSTGKWYWEVTVTGGGNNRIGICLSSLSGTDSYNTGTGTYVYNGLNGQKYIAGTGSTYGATFTTNDVIGVAVDADAGTVVFYKNNSSQGTAFSGLNFATSSYSPTISVAGSGTSMVTNFGQRPFAYTPPSGFLSLCTTNLPASTILKGGDYFNPVLYAGNGSTQTITGVGFQPDWVWAKNRTTAGSNHRLFDAVRGASKILYSSLTNAEATDANGLTAFNSDGFSIGSTQINDSGSNFVAWCWKANGAGSSNTAGTITSTVSANTTSGFSIVTWAGNSTNAATIGHGLGVAPSILITKSRTNASSWVFGIGGISGFGVNDYLVLQSTAAKGTSSTFYQAYGSSTFTVGVSAADEMNKTGNNYVTYCFAAISGYSAFGSYTGNGSTDGPFVYLGFRPRFILIKRSSDIDDWFMYDTARSPYNPMNFVLSPNSSAADTATTNPDDLSNGFKLRSTSGGTNASGSTYIYACFAENPFKNALAR
jgi:hypothetical protein